MDSQRTRQEIYDRIRETSRDEFILEEMKRLGFWHRTYNTPSLPEEMIKKEGELQRELHTLLQEKRTSVERYAAKKDGSRKRKKKSDQREERTGKNTKSSRMGREKRKGY